MILVDYRECEKDKRGNISTLLPGSEVTTLPYGDVQFMGHSPSGPDTLLIGVEIKKISDLLSSIESGRFAADQLPGLVQTYDRRYVLVEGIWRRRFQDGLLEWPRANTWVPAGHSQRKWTWNELTKWVSSIEEFGDVRFKYTSNRTDTAAMILSMHAWWQTPREKHHSHLAMNTGRAALNDIDERIREAQEERGQRVAMLRRPPLVRRIAAELDGVGHMKSLEVMKKFKTVKRMVRAGVDEWCEISGIGKKTALNVIEGWDSEQ